MKEDEGEDEELMIHIEMMMKRCEANLLHFALQAGLYRACPRDRANEEQLSRPAGDDPVREEKKALRGSAPGATQG